MRRSWVLLPAIVLAGCGSLGYDRSMVQARLQSEDLQVTDKEIQQVLTLKPQLAFPCRIAVYLRSDQGSSSSPLDSGWRWTPEDKKLLQSWAAALRQEGIASDVFVMSDMFAPRTNGEQPSLKELRLAAAHYGAEALFVLRGNCQSESRRNPAGILDLTIVGGYVVPGSTCAARFILQGGLVDVRNGVLYATLESEGESKMIRPTFLVDEKTPVEQAKAQALANFGPELLQHMHNLRDAFVPLAHAAID
jgi:hypothetical protein